MTGRFAPGEILIERYRIISLLGKGGMGEVYRADDLELEQPVALKFLPRELALDPSRLARFRDEARIARQVSHGNVCRVYDIGEADGQYFLSMEHVDGEDLASLLRRIGHLSHEKGVEIARQLCAGLAAAHEKGFIHRDLKPANIMIDGRGLVRIMDFGLAALAGGATGEGGIAGTPAYMAPEQLAGRDASVRSDLYALGLVLYEIFTGKAVHGSGSIADIRRRQRDSTPAAPSSIVSGLDPAVERIILHCLETDPEMRPPSAISVAAALPGGDPLAAALAAGEMPSPEIVAAAGLRGALRPGVGWACLAGVLLAVGLSLFLARYILLAGRVPLRKPPAVLVDRAREIVRSLGYADEPLDTAVGVSINGAYLRYVAANDSSTNRWDTLADLRPPAAFLWYRESPELLVASATDGKVGRDDPPQTLPGMRQLGIDPRGRLVFFDAVPPEAADPGLPALAGPDWSVLFAAAELERDRFAPTDSMWNPPVFCDSVAAWVGSFAERPGMVIRAEAGAYRGRPVYFRVLGPWNRPAGEAGPQRAAQRAAQVLNVGLIVAALLGASLIVRRNLRQGLGDRRGAIRVALAVFAIQMASWLLGASHVPSPSDELNLFVRGVGEALFFSLFLWLLYMALEPTVRRRWPTRIISWSRLLTGRWRDPLVGRDILLGILCGAASFLVVRLASSAPALLHQAPLTPQPNGLDTITSSAAMLGALLRVVVISVMNALFFVFFPLLLSIVLRRLSLGIGVLLAILLAMFVLSSRDPLAALVPGVVLIGLWAFAALRLGLLSSAASFFAFFSLMALPMTTDTSAWFFKASLLGLFIVIAVAGYGLRMALGRAAD